MSKSVFDQMMDRYVVLTAEDHTNALHEVMQQITLASSVQAC